VVPVRLPQQVGEDDGSGTGFAHSTAGEERFVSFIVICLGKKCARGHALPGGKLEKVVAGMSWYIMGMIKNWDQ
jgi:hypothetical protein